MAQYTEPKKRINAHPLWGVDTFKQEIAKMDGRSLRAILEQYATESTGWRGLYNDVRRWRHMDPDLQKMIDDHIKSPNRANPATSGSGRKRKDEVEGNHDWRLAYVEEYLRTSSREKASMVTPYKPSTILSMLHPSKTEYDKQFAEMVGTAEQMIVDRVSSVALDALNEAVAQGADAKTKAWIALGILKTHPKGWQQKMELNVTGSVKFELDRGRQVAELLADQQRYFANTRPLALVSGDVVDAEEVKDA